MDTTHEKPIFFSNLLISLFVLTISCQKETIVDSTERFTTANPTTTPEPDLPPGELMVLGPQLENPYSVENMKKALKSLKKSSRAELPVPYEVGTTHLYVKFLPQNEAHLDSLSLDDDLILYGYPLDREVENIGDYYIDPESPTDRPMPLYASVVVDYALPRSVPYEILSHLHIPKDYGDYEFIEANQRQLSHFTEALVDESLRLTGNWEEVAVSPHNRSRRWRPSGKIQNWDSTKKKLVGVQGLKVRARRWFTTHVGFTDSNGSFHCNGRFRRKARYSFAFKRYDFKIRDSNILFDSAGKRGPKMRKAWDYTMVGNSQKYYATIFQAAYHILLPGY